MYWLFIHLKTQSEFSDFPEKTEFTELPAGCKTDCYSKIIYFNNILFDVHQGEILSNLFTKYRVSMFKTVVRSSADNESDVCDDTVNKRTIQIAYAHFDIHQMSRV